MTQRPTCAVPVSGAQVQLQLQAAWCVDGDLMCPAACARWTAPCAVPALAAGDYAVTVDGAPVQTLAVRAGASATSCALP